MSDNSRVRISIIGVVIVALFSSLLARLWFLQMGPERDLKAVAIASNTRKIVTDSPRGRILDRNGNVLAADRAAWAVTVDRNLKPGDRNRLLGQLSELLGKPQTDLQANYDSPRQSVLKPPVVALDITPDQRLSIMQQQDDYPGVHIEQLTVRTYPMALKLRDPALAAQVLGYVGEIPSEQLKALKKKGYQPGSLIGRDGIEAAYESDLRGDPEIETVQVDPTGKQVGPPIAVHKGAVGRDVQLTIDANIQRVAEQALADGMTAARTLKVPLGEPPATAPAGSAIVLDAQDGSVVAMASNPSFPPVNWVGGIKQADFDALNNPALHNPLVNRATQGQYAPGSTFKLVTSLAETKYGYRTPYTPYVDSGSVIIGGDRRSFHNDQFASNGTIALARALSVSSDTYFYTAGDMFWQSWYAGDTARGLGLQQEARDVGLDAKTGIEIDESTGRIPDPAWKQSYADANYKDAATRKDYGTWYPGDEVNLAVGQGDVLVTPLQLANAYACFANGGTLWQPHLGMAVKDSMSNRVVHSITPKALRTIAFDPLTHQQMQIGFTGAVQDARPTGTAYNAFLNSDVQSLVMGKTGTAQVVGKAPTSLFVGMYPTTGPKYVVMAAVEEGGHGAETAAPIVRRIIEALAGVKHSAPIIASTGHD
jgi:penicillin-binding protein 2